MKKTTRLIAPILGAGLVFGVTFASASEKVTVEPEDNINWELSDANMDVMVEESADEVVTHVIQPGNTLENIAAVYDYVTVDDLLILNPDIDPYNLVIGTEIVVVAPLLEYGEDYVYHTIQPGNTFYEIANMYDGIAVEELLEVNPNKDPYNLQIGSNIIIPLD